MGLAFHEEREKFTWGWEEGVSSQPWSAKGKNFLFSLGWACHSLGQSQPPDYFFEMLFLATRRQGVSWCGGSLVGAGVSGLFGAVIILRVFLCSNYSQTFSKDT